MKKPELEHILRAAGSISESDEMVVLGSQAILASFPDAPESLLVSMEADLYPLENPERADLIERIPWRRLSQHKNHIPDRRALLECRFSS
jgi:hypothetical protein